MKRVIIICEGQTEQAFVKTTMSQQFVGNGILLETPLIKSSRGGIVKWDKLKSQIEMHLKSDLQAFVTTFIDYYGIYSKFEFPGWDEAQQIPDKNRRMDSIESSMSESIDDRYRFRFIPYMQLHEFEGLLFNEIQIFHDQIPPDDLVSIEELNATFREYDNPEFINNSRDTSPSHRLARIINGYNKVVYGDILAEAIGLTRIRNKSPRFNNWLHKLENI